MYPDYKYEGHAWGMAIDLSSCVGCNACVVACQSENNIPVVGKDQVARGREMHWIRVDRYFEAASTTRSVHHQPHALHALRARALRGRLPGGRDRAQRRGPERHGLQPLRRHAVLLEQLPVQGAALQLLLYQDWDTPSLKLLRNPDVTVRSRGVMEKCTYCVQRIQRVKIDARNQKRPIKDGEITPACAQACAAQSIVFGDVNDPQSAVSKLKALPRNYGVLEDLNTRPRTTYLGSVKNPNPELARG
jgi:molybdopterin-containing oxidoreductase family iron-sulfur binding subunit